MFQLTKREANSLLLQIARAKTGRGGRQTPPYAFTELGVAMLSSVLNSERAVQMNIVIMRAFVRLRELLATNKALARKVEQMGRTQKEHGFILVAVVKEIKQLKTLPVGPPKRTIGFTPECIASMLELSPPHPLEDKRLEFWWPEGGQTDVPSISASKQTQADAQFPHNS